MYGNAATVPSHWVGFFLVALLVVLCPGCARDTGSADRLALESDNQTPCLVDSQEMAPAAQVGTWAVPDEWSDETGAGGTLMGYREPTDNSAPPTETASEEEWTPEPMGDTEDSSCYTVTYPTPDEDEYMQTISDTPSTESDEQMQAVPETPNTETDEASGLVDDEDPNYRDDRSPPSMTEDEDTASPTGQTDDGNNDPALGPSP